ncbi:uncharacterized protein [Palaemon carinicauda]|uniref:uncharacterized protein n=1 Tax=Palaemon carinicauda TaxID=392227 RepID=UPI0035B6653D
MVSQRRFLLLDASPTQPYLALLSHQRTYKCLCPPPHIIPGSFSFRTSSNTLGSCKHGIYHHVKMTGPQLLARFKRLTLDLFSAPKQTVAEMEDMGLCQKSSSSWSSSLHIVLKKDGSLFPRGDCRCLNMKIELDHNPFPNTAMLDLLKGYYSVPMKTYQTSQNCHSPFGTLTFNYSCFDLRNARATFQRLMDSILVNLPFFVCYVDDALQKGTPP